MAEFCLECFNKHVLPEGYEPRQEKDVTLSKEPDLCEGCGELKRVVILDVPDTIRHRLSRKMKLALWKLFRR